MIERAPVTYGELAALFERITKSIEDPDADRRSVFGLLFLTYVRYVRASALLGSRLAPSEPVDLTPRSGRA
jgi:hypothetical protein